MTSILQSLSKTVHLSLAIAILLFIGLYIGNGGFDFDVLFWSWLLRYVHVTVSIMWIGLLWYFNFVQIPNMAKIPDEQKPAIGKVIAPAALFWFRWAALFTIISGLLLAYFNGYVQRHRGYRYATGRCGSQAACRPCRRTRRNSAARSSRPHPRSGLPACRC